LLLGKGPSVTIVEVAGVYPTVVLDAAEKRKFLTNRYSNSHLSVVQPVAIPTTLSRLQQFYNLEEISKQQSTSRA
jgi:hypothetical protein